MSDTELKTLVDPETMKTESPATATTPATTAVPAAATAVEKPANPVPIAAGVTHPQQSAQTDPVKALAQLGTLANIVRMAEAADAEAVKILEAARGELSTVQAEAGKVYAKALSLAQANRQDAIHAAHVAHTKALADRDNALNTVIAARQKLQSYVSTGA